ncbi:hypothetical protein [Facklamia lactis]|uniref:hypothetical protein n=1 Tax=Facklamia lactis TaxID=2749967 RepID=UPI0018CF97CA|nr:hypothetical protein [Facklamia lactis]MBG9981033.1 hypothetical protein [Facklamia lactis]
MKIFNRDILIRNAEMTDANTLYKWWTDGSVMEHAGFPKGLSTSIEKIQKEIEKYNDRKRTLIIEYKSLAIGNFLVILG